MGSYHNEEEVGAIKRTGQNHSLMERDFGAEPWTLFQRIFQEENSIKFFSGCNMANILSFRRKQKECQMLWDIAEGRA